MAFPGIFSTLGPNSVDIAVRILGAQQVASATGAIERNLRRFQSRANAAGAAATEGLATRVGIAATAIGVAGYAALRATSDFRRFEIGLQSLTSSDVGSRLARQVTEFGAASAYSNAEIMRMSQLLVAMGTPIDKLMPRLKAIANLTAQAGGNTETFSRAALAIGQIQAAGVLRGQELRQLTEAGIPVSRLAQAMGMTVGQVIKSEATIPAERVMQALERLGGTGDVQGRLSREVPMIRLANMLDRINIALIPVGRALNTLAQPLFYLAEAALGVFQKFSELTSGYGPLVWLGLHVGMVWRGLQRMFAAMTLATSALRGLAASATASSIATRMRHVAGGAPQGRALLNPVNVAAGAAGAGGIGKKAAQRIAATKIGQAFAKKLAARGAAMAAGGWIPIAGWVLDAALIGWTLYDLATMGKQIEAATKEAEKELAQDPAMRPHQRSDVENVQQRLSFGY